MQNLRSASLLAAFILTSPAAALAQDADADASAESGVHKEAGENVETNADIDVNADAEADPGALETERNEADLLSDDEGGGLGIEDQGDIPGVRQNESQ